MEQEHVEPLKTLIQNASLNLHEELQKILYNPSAKNGQLNVVRKSLEPFFQQQLFRMTLFPPNLKTFIQ